jgi:tetratricopeptide (TPR) repeat protein
VNYRPEYRHDWGNRTYYTQLRLDPLERETAQEMLEAMLGAESELKPLKRMIIERTEGNPFFMEEIVQALFDEGVLVRDGAVRMLKPLGEVKVPLTVQGVLAARIDRLGPEQRELLQTLAVLGKECGLGLLRRVSGKPDEELERMLGELQAAEFIYEQPALPEVEYTFKHGLTQEVAYNSALIERRRLLHARAAQALETLYKESLDDRVAELAHHYQRAGDAPKAAEYLERAGRQAAARSAFREAEESCRTALAMLSTLPESAARDARELTLTLALGQTLLLTRGMSAAETVATYSRARALSERAAELSQQAATLMGLGSAFIVAGDYEGAQGIAEQFQELAGRGAFNPAFVGANAVLAWTCCYRGRPADGEEHYLKLRALLDEERLEEGALPPSVLGVRTIALLGVGPRTAVFMGKADIARARARELIKLAQQFRYSYDLSNAQMVSAILYATLREFEEAEKWTAQSVATAEEHGFPLFASIGRVLYGYAVAHRGRVEEGIEAIRLGLLQQREIGCHMGNTLHLAFLAEAQGVAGQLEQALQTVEEASRANPQELLYRPHILQVRGELRLKLGQSELAEGDFREAVALAQKMSAKAFELRAAMDLARMLEARGDRPAARDLLAPLYTSFTEGFDTPDLKEAKALLDELAE